MRLGRYDEAIIDAGELLHQAQKSEKGFYRAARAFYELGRFRECHETFELLLARYPTCDLAKQEKIKAKCRLKEQQSGEFDFKAMYRAAALTPPSLDHATFIGPIERKISEHGTGMFTTEAVVAGQLLLCEKAFAHCFAADEAGPRASQSGSRTTLLMDTHTNHMVMGTQADLMTMIVQKLKRNPSLMPQVTSLYHGDYTPVKELEVDGVPVIDTYLISHFP